MTSPRKSPNMMSTTGRLPAMAAPTPIPVKPGSEIGVSITRSVPNSSTSPLRTLKGVPASATSSPMTKTVSSRRISSAIASLMAWAMVSSRDSASEVGSGADISHYLIRVGIRRRRGERDRFAEFLAQGRGDGLQGHVVGQPLGHYPGPGQLDWIPLLAPELLFFTTSVIASVDIADVVTEVAIGVAEKEARTVADPSPRDRRRGGLVDRADVLAIHLGGWDAEGGRAVDRESRDGLRSRGVLTVKIVLADIDHGKSPERGHVHDLVENPLAQGSIADETDRDLVGLALLDRESGAGRYSQGTPDDGVGSQVAPLLVGDVHRAPLASAVAGGLAQELGKHQLRFGALGETVAVAAMGAGDVVVVP